LLQPQSQSLEEGKKSEPEEEKKGEAEEEKELS
jgi:hypothetical protein